MENNAPTLPRQIWPLKAWSSADASRWGKLLLLALLAWFFAWDLRAILLDGRIQETDTTLQAGITGLKILPEDPVAFILDMDKGIPLGLLVNMLGHLLNAPLVAARLVSVLLHAAVLWMACMITVRLTQRWSAGLLAALVCGVFPGEFGWFRLEYPEPLVTLLVLWTIGTMITWSATRRDNIRLGVILGLGLLSKPSFIVYILFPVLCFIGYHLRSRRALWHALQVSLAAAVVSAPFLIASIPDLLELAGMSTQISTPALEKLRFYGENLSGSRWYLMAAAAGGLLARFQLGLAWRPLVLLASSTFGGWLLLCLVFDTWTRYLVPTLPLAGILVALGLTGLLDRVAARSAPMARCLAAACVVGALALYGQMNLGWTKPIPRGDADGMVAPDRRHFDAFPRMVSRVQSMGEPALYIPIWEGVVRNDASEWIWRCRGHVMPTLGLDSATRRLAKLGSVLLVLPHRTGQALEQFRKLQQQPESPEVSREMLAFVRSREARVLAMFQDPDGVHFSLFRLTDPRP